MFSPFVLCDKMFNACFNFPMNATYPCHIGHPNNVRRVIRTVKLLITYLSTF
jgi:hypothetical protein